MNGAECEPHHVGLPRDARVSHGDRRRLRAHREDRGREEGADRRRVGQPDAIEAIEAGGTTDRSIPVEVARASRAIRRAPRSSSCSRVSGRTVPARALPSAVGVPCRTSRPRRPCRRAALAQKPLLDRVLTVTGPGIVQPRNVRAPLGASPRGHRRVLRRHQARDQPHGRGRPDDGPRASRPRRAAHQGHERARDAHRTRSARGRFRPCIRCSAASTPARSARARPGVDRCVEVGARSTANCTARSTATSVAAAASVRPSSRPLVQFMQVAKSALRAPPPRGARHEREQPDVRPRPGRTCTPRNPPRRSCGGSTVRSPGRALGVFVFGFNAAFVILASIAGAVLTEFASQKALGRRPTLMDGSAVCTGLLLALTVNPNLPAWQAFRRRVRDRAGQGSDLRRARLQPLQSGAARPRVPSWRRSRST